MEEITLTQNITQYQGNFYQANERVHDVAMDNAVVLNLTTKQGFVQELTEDAPINALANCDALCSTGASPCHLLFGIAKTAAGQNILGLAHLSSISSGAYADSFKDLFNKFDIGIESVNFQLFGGAQASAEDLKVIQEIAEEDGLNLTYQASTKNIEYLPPEGKTVHEDDRVTSIDGFFTSANELVIQQFNPKADEETQPTFVGEIYRQSFMPINLTHTITVQSTPYYQPTRHNFGEIHSSNTAATNLKQDSEEKKAPSAKRKVVEMQEKKISENEDDVEDVKKKETESPTQQERKKKSRFDKEEDDLKKDVQKDPNDHENDDSPKFTF